MSGSVLERIAAGDESAVRECMDQYGGLVWTLARRFSESAADAEDASQEIFLELWRVAARFDPALAPESVFVTTLARRRLIDRLRARNRRPRAEVYDEQEADLGLTSDASPEPLFFGAEVAAAKAALAELNAGEREILLLGIVEGMTHSEIATRTGRPLGTVKTQLRRGLEKVRRKLGKGGDDG
ncbi:MAG: sigma-70 family RNA polymerase sigma factor [Lysobacterales bacterium]|nr:MAG: sigma-70 family RNA polymerase sigma factor [Xanthomonadales bacterium]